MKVVPGKTFRDYITEYMERAKNDQIHRLAVAFGLNESLLRNLMALKITDENINEFGRFDALKSTIDRTKAVAYFERTSGKKLPLPLVNIRAEKLLRDFIKAGGFDIDDSGSESSSATTPYAVPIYHDIAAETGKYGNQNNSNTSH